jgi:hypothetical protein
MGGAFSSMQALWVAVEAELACDALREGCQNAGESTQWTESGDAITRSHTHTDIHAITSVAADLCRPEARMLTQTDVC